MPRSPSPSGRATERSSKRDRSKSPDRGSKRSKADRDDRRDERDRRDDDRRRGDEDGRRDKDRKDRDRDRDRDRERDRDRDGKDRDRSDRDRKERDGKDRDGDRDRDRRDKDRDDRDEKSGREGGRRRSPSPRVKREEDEEGAKPAADGVVKQEPNDVARAMSPGAAKKAEPLSLEELLKKKKQQQEEESKPRFLTKAERQALALAKLEQQRAGVQASQHAKMDSARAAAPHAAAIRAGLGS